ncbi:hypothetical protein [Mangrovihabitans endophyticus]|uniref:PH domain-containing protein n=1 Tax=Mangrovihabitans endophyticus TaxID=1751298 RepID=A0A8J3C2K8_9ACTN|nr:hypothetical protein [Mangrovihabitans endophyticus]GGL00911.1 hypothetical protein GCM10012284_39330 [Mangrovihabitans endophyticus]
MPDQEPPAAWPQPHRSADRVLAVVGFVLLALLTAVLAVAAAVAGDIVMAIVLLLATVMFGHVAGLALSTLRRPAPPAGWSAPSAGWSAPSAGWSAPSAGPVFAGASSAGRRVPSAGLIDEPEAGMAFRYARSAYYWFTVVLAFGVVFAAAFMIGLARVGTAAAWVMAAVFAGCGLLIAWYLTVVLRLAPGVVVLTPTGIYHRSLAIEHFVPWEAVVGVLARQGRTPWITVKTSPTAPAAPTAQAAPAAQAAQTRERRHAGALSPDAQFLPFMVIRAYWLGANAGPAYQAIKHYAEHPNERPNLAAGAPPGSVTV